MHCLVFSIGDKAILTHKFLVGWAAWIKVKEAFGQQFSSLHFPCSACCVRPAGSAWLRNLPLHSLGTVRPRYLCVCWESRFEPYVWALCFPRTGADGDSSDSEDEDDSGSEPSEWSPGRSPSMAGRQMSGPQGRSWLPKRVF